MSSNAINHIFQLLSVMPVTYAKAVDDKRFYFHTKGLRAYSPPVEVSAMRGAYQQDFFGPTHTAPEQPAITVRHLGSLSDHFTRLSLIQVLQPDGKTPEIITLLTKQPSVPTATPLLSSVGSPLNTEIRRDVSVPFFNELFSAIGNHVLNHLPK